MKKRQTIQEFWSRFQLPAYDENTVPEKDENGNKITMPYITYEARFDSFGENLALTGSLWYRSTSWSAIEEKAAEIEKYIGRGGVIIPYEDGTLWITRSTPFSQRMSDPNDDSVRRIVINLSAEFTSAD